jgi:hypothetical protein
MRKHLIGVAAATSFAAAVSAYAQMRPCPPPTLEVEGGTSAHSECEFDEPPELKFENVPQMRKWKMPQRQISDIDRVEFAMAVKKFLQKNHIGRYAQYGLPRDTTLPERKALEALAQLRAVNKPQDDVRDARLVSAVQDARDITEDIMDGNMRSAGIGILIGMSNQTDEDGEKSMAEFLVETTPTVLLKSFRAAGPGILLEIGTPVVMGDGTLTSKDAVDRLIEFMSRELTKYDDVRKGNHVLSLVRSETEMRSQMKEEKRPSIRMP